MWAPVWCRSSPLAGFAEDAAEYERGMVAQAAWDRQLLVGEAGLRQAYKAAVTKADRAFARANEAAMAEYMRFYDNDDQSRAHLSCQTARAEQAHSAALYAALSRRAEGAKVLLAEAGDRAWVLDSAVGRWASWVPGED